MERDFTFRRGDICWYRDPMPSGDSYVLHETRPAVVISSDTYNEKSGTVVIVPMTRNTTRRCFSNQIDIVIDGIRSRIRCDQVRVTDKSTLFPPHAKLDDTALEALEDALLNALGFNMEKKSTATLAVMYDC